MGLPERTGYPAGWVGMQASERDRSVLALLTGNGAVSVHPDRIETSDRDTFHIGAWAAEIRAGTAVAVGAGVGNAASVACTFGLQRDCGAEGVGGLDTMKYYKQASKIRHGAPTGECSLTKSGEIVVGKFIDRERPDYYELLQAQMHESLGDRYAEPEVGCSEC